MILHITKSGSSATKKDGTPLKDKRGSQYFRSWIKTQEYGDQFLRGFTYQDVQQWEGKSIELEVFEEEYQGKKQLKFRIPQAWKLTKEMWDMMTLKIEQLEAQLGESRVEDEGISPDEIPF